MDNFTFMNHGNEIVLQHQLDQMDQLRRLNENYQSNNSSIAVSPKSKSQLNEKYNPRSDTVVLKNKCIDNGNIGGMTKDGILWDGWMLPNQR